MTRTNEGDQFRESIYKRKIALKADPDKCPHEHFKTLKRKLFGYLAVMSQTGNGDLPGHFTSQHVEGAPTLCVKTRPMAIFTKLFE